MKGRREMLNGLADYFLVLSSLLREPPAAEGLMFLMQTGLFRSLPAPLCEEVVETAESIQSVIDGHCAGLAQAEAFAQALRREHFRILVGAGRPAAPPWSGYYRQSERMIFSEESLKDSDWFASKGLICADRGIPEDALANQLEFLGRLLCSEPLQARQYLEERILPWIEAWERDASAAEGELYPLLAGLIFHSVNHLEVVLHEENCCNQ